MIHKLLRLFFRHPSPPPAPAWLDRIEHLDPEGREEDRRAAQGLARALHGHALPMPALGRREVAVLHAARRRRPAELLEAVQGLSYPAALRLAERLAPRPGLDRQGLAAAARHLVETSPEREVVLAALALLALAPTEEDLPLLERVARSATGAPAAMRVATAIPALRRPALLSLVKASSGIGRALALEELLRRGAPVPEEAPALLSLLAEVEDPLERAWGSVPLLEAVDVPSLLAENPSLAETVVLALEANARGGWRGGPGPGLGRLLGSIRAAEALLEGEFPDDLRKRSARAVIEAHPAPAGKAVRLAQAFIERERA